MTCENALELLSAALDGELSLAQEALLKEHLASCPHCRALQQELAGLHDAFSDLDTEAPAGLKEEILDHLPTQRPSRVVYWKRWGTAAAVLALVALAAWRFPWPAGSDSAAPAAAPAAVAGGAADMAAVASMDQAETAGEGEDLMVEAVTADDEAVILDAEEERRGAAKERDAVFAASRQAAPIALPAGGAEVYGTAEDMADSLLDSGMPMENGGDAQSYGEEKAALTMGAADPGEVPEEPETADQETAVDFEPVEEVTDRDFSAYQGVLTIREGDFEGDYPRQRQSNGEMWYLIPSANLQALVDRLDSTGAVYDLRLTGQDLTKDSGQCLVIIPNAP